jgi:hypothetical protein
MKRLRKFPAKLRATSNHLTQMGFENHPQIKYGMVRFTKLGAEALFNAIRGFVPSCMQHKLPEAHRGFYTPYRLTSSELTVPYYVRPAKIHPGRFRSGYLGLYDIAVPPHANFVAGHSTGGIVVHNSPETTSGGRALRFFASMRLDVRRREAIKTPEGTVVGFAGNLKVVKNKVAPPFRESPFEILFNQGISPESSLVALGIEHKVLEKKCAWISHKGVLLGQGQPATREHLKQTPALAQQIYSEIHNKLVELKLVATPLRSVEGEPPEMPEDDEK